MIIYNLFLFGKIIYNLLLINEKAITGVDSVVLIIISMTLTVKLNNSELSIQSILNFNIHIFEPITFLAKKTEI